jgi:hypothetical protein
VLFGGYDGLDDQEAEATGSTCYCNSGHNFKCYIDAI